MQVLIAGGGIGGLAAAPCLHRAGVEATVFEAAAALHPLGVGINLLPHAVRILTHLGLGSRLAEAAVATAELVYCNKFGRPIGSAAARRAIAEIPPIAAAPPARNPRREIDRMSNLPECAVRVAYAPRHYSRREATVCQARGESAMTDYPGRSSSRLKRIGQAVRVLNRDPGPRGRGPAS